jgi:hypothetical protein
LFSVFGTSLNDVSIAIEVSSLRTWNSEILTRAHILGKEGLRVGTSDYSSTLIVQKRGWRPFQNGDFGRWAMCEYCEGVHQTSKRTADNNDMSQLGGM